MKSAAWLLPALSARPRAITPRSERTVRSSRRSPLRSTCLRGMAQRPPCAINLTDESTQTPNDRKIMNIRPLLLLVCTLWASSLFAAPAEQDIFAWLRVLGSPNAGSREVFDALHTKAEPAKTFIKRVEGPLLIPPPAIYPLEFRSSNGSSNNINNLGTAGFPDLRNTTN